ARRGLPARLERGEHLLEQSRGAVHARVARRAGDRRPFHAALQPGEPARSELDLEPRLLGALRADPDERAPAERGPERRVLAVGPYLDVPRRGRAEAVD